MIKTKKPLKIDLAKGATLFEMYDYLCSKIDWGKSWLDADAVACMDTLFRELRTDKRIVKR